jgi:hypothetical protein
MYGWFCTILPFPVEMWYIRKHEDYNLTHLKMFITATVSYIQSELTLQIATDLLGTPK